MFSRVIGGNVSADGSPREVEMEIVMKSWKILDARKRYLTPSPPSSVPSRHLTTTTRIRKPKRDTTQDTRIRSLTKSD
ncbi:Protein of unknown function [Pyronema omphalodes CBS 100304]|uniref:Uncharacterized protein n=1 Tax=Pyronema omphalodes (strain CBS 100304) TaxID=1076935 RepID=U4LG59_PYROM|nr:Protein of unknown function [Pyronema omphalodes CBS 100304]